MASAEGLFLLAGGVAVAGNMAESKSFPPDAYKIIGATIALVLISSVTRNGILAGPTKALAGLMLLVSVYIYVPAFTKGKDNG